MLLPAFYASYIHEFTLYTLSSTFLSDPVQTLYFVPCFPHFQTSGFYHKKVCSGGNPAVTFSLPSKGLVTTQLLHVLIEGPVCILILVIILYPDVLSSEKISGKIGHILQSGQ